MENIYGKIDAMKVDSVPLLGFIYEKICVILSTIYLSCAQPFHTNVGSIV